MSSPSSYREFLRTSGNSNPSPENLEQYLRRIIDEDWHSEFKTVADPALGDFGVRKAIASLGNHEGGELFIGVRDGDRALVGTGLRKVDLFGRLRQDGASESWYSLDLSPLATETTEVQLTNLEKRVLVVEVRRGALPSLVVSNGGNLAWYERSGNSDHELNAVEGIRSIRRFSRGKLLLDLYNEFREVVGTIPDTCWRGNFNIERHFSLPRFDNARANGEVSVLSEEDRGFLIARPGQTVAGILPRFLEAGRRIQHRVEEHRRLNRMDGDWNVDVDNDLRSEREMQRERLEEFRRYLQSAGILPRDPAH